MKRSNALRRGDGKIIPTTAKLDEKIKNSQPQEFLFKRSRRLKKYSKRKKLGNGSILLLDRSRPRI